ncbi:hypothetical protein [Peribacillus sp. TH24]|uniref:hypothetical protein n=1 Tax=Peribacillus sp. TH24 TaxID=2798483 RepID=UPI0019126A02|nr:hypothetical protein [Peribacillus sp. TH24]MBK5446054.1 hypothetical protein [Peribacillus sp. TH24]
MIPSIVQLAGAILLAILIFVRNDKQSIKSTIPIVSLQGKKNPKIKDAIKETWVIRFGLSLVIVGYILQILGVDFDFLLKATRWIKFGYTVILTAILVLIFYFIAERIAKTKFEKISPFDKDNDDDYPDGAIMFDFDE